ncbi:hypothetical protein ABIB25_003682 [Nakamurella sp. UYEF19]|uniref:hypothetical protein n=1 Tax=Nakamurella sp. UYEF19 TaxID=1756392 RepID=UPI0033922678
MFLLILSLANRSDHPDSQWHGRLLTGLFIVLMVMNLVSCVATVIVWRSERTRWPSIHRLATPHRLRAWSWVAGATVLLATVAWLLGPNFPSALFVQFTGMVMAWVWRNHDRRQHDHLLLELAAIDASATGIQQPPIRWS